MKLDNETTNSLITLSNSILAITKGFAAIGKHIESILENATATNQLELTLDKPIDMRTIKFKFAEKFDAQHIHGNKYENTNFIPTKGSEHAAAYDLRAYIKPDVIDILGDKVGEKVVASSETTIISTNLEVEVPIGFKLTIVPRSGYGSKGIIITNSPGTIDADYRGTVGIIVHNLNATPFVIQHGDRIAQCYLEKVEDTEWKYSEVLSDTARGSGGFGSTGVK